MNFAFSLSRFVHWADRQPPRRPRYYRIFHSICRIGLITAQEFTKNELSLRAAALTFTVMLSLVPILALSTAVVKGLGGSDELRAVVYSYVATIDGSASAPAAGERQAGEGEPQGITQHLYSAVDKIFNYVERTNFTTLGTIGVAGIFLSVILVLGNIEKAMNAIWHVAVGRSVIRKISDYLTLLILMPLSINVGLAASAVLKSDALLSKFNVLLPMVWLQALVLKLIPIFFLALTLYVIYLFFPNTKVKTIPALVGALFAGFFWFQVQNIYIGLQVGVSKYNAIYGSFATLPLFLVWLYFGWVFILLGAQIAYACQNHDSLRLVALQAPPSLRLSLAYDLLGYIEEGFRANREVDAPGFHDAYPMYPIGLIEDTVAQLREHGLVHAVEGKGILKPSQPADKVDHKTIIAAIIGATFSDTEGGKKSSRVLESAAIPLSQSRPSEGDSQQSRQRS